MLRRRNLLKRVLPILLSLAMMLQSVPMTAMAAELPVAATAEEADAATEPAEETEAAVEPTEETEAAVESTEDADAAESAAQPEEDATVADDAAAEDGVQSDETAENTEEQPDAVTEEDGAKSDDAAEDSESKPETVKKPVAETETEVAANGADAQKPGVAKIVVDDRAVKEWLPDGDFVRELDKIDEETGKPVLSFLTEYVEGGKTDKLQSAVKEWISVEVDGEKVDALKDSLTYTWKDEKGVQLVDAVPVNAGTYELTISLDAAIDLYETVEPAKLTLIIEPARVELWIDPWTQPGKTVGDFIDKNNENYQIVYADRKDDEGNPRYTVSRDIIDIPDKKLPMHIVEIDESGARKELTETPTEKFDSTKDYILTIDPVALTANAAANYKLALDDFWKIVVGERQITWIDFERKAVGEDLIKVYDEKAVTIEEVTKDDFFTETGAPAVYVWDDKLEKDVILEGAEPVAGWYTRIQLNEGESYELDEDAGEFRYYDYKWDEENQVENKWTRDNYIYKPMNADPVDAGEYYIVWNYVGDAGAYKKARPSEAIRYTIDPAPVVINIDPDSYETTEKGAQLGFADGMTAEDVNKTLAKLKYGAYPIVENDEGVLEVGKEKVNKDPEFFGTSYGIENTTNMTQYFVPEFVLQRRPVKMTEKGGNVVDVDERTVDWKEVTGILNVVVNEDIKSIAGELPQGTVPANLESVEFAFRVYFTGNKVVYRKGGTKETFGGVPVTDVTTNAANRNYLADITNARLEASAVLLDVASAKEVTIDTDAIVKAFVEDNPDSLYPQPAEGTDDPHKGTMPEPAVKIYDQKGLFAKRASYKQAKVHELDENGETVKTVAEDTNEKLTYTWNFISLDDYEAYLETWDEVQRQYKDFDDYYFQTIESLGTTDMDDGSLTDPKSVGVYRLTVKFDDTDREYRSAEAEVFFKVEAQEVIVVPKEQYVAKDSNINVFKNSLPNKLENRNDYIIYKLPQNSEDDFNKLTDEEKKNYEIPTEEALTLFEKENGKEFRKKIVNNWKVLRKEKNSEGKDTEVWIEATGAFEEGYTYGIVANWTGSLTNLDGEVSGNNYTTKDVKTFRTTGEEKHHEFVGDVKFYDGKIYVEVDKEKIEALGHEYDGEAVSLEKVAEALTFYTDVELKNKLTEDSKTVLNLNDEYDPAKINVYWQKDGKYYANKNAVYGGEYSLLLLFEGGTLTMTSEAAPQDDAVETEETKYAPLESNGTSYGLSNGYRVDEDNWVYYDAKFTVTPRALTITPKLLDASILKAGDEANKLVTGDLEFGRKDKDGNIEEDVLDKDEKFFSYVELAKGGIDVTYEGKNADGTDKEGYAYGGYNINRNGGYPAFNGSAWYAIQADGRELKNPNADYLRFGSTYTVKLKNELVSPLRESYRVTYAPAALEEITKRGNAEVVKLDSVDRLDVNRIVYNFSNSTYTVMPRASVKFYGVGEGITVKDRYGKDKTLENTNILGFSICAPKEFWSDGKYADWDEELDTWSVNLHADKFVYQNAIWNAGGYFYHNDGDDENGNGILDFDETTDWNNHCIDVVFPLTKDNVNPSFDITWEDGYTETFSLADVALEEDLTKAVAPKSMAFNGVATKMAVGERQQLNLKITKAQLGDVIAVRYRIKGSEETKNDYISLDPETGVVTGLMAGKVATQIEAYAVYKDAKGNFVPVVDNKGKQKVATTKITVTEVTASTIKKIVAQGETAKVYFTVPDNGYRREVYVVDVADNAAAKKWKAAQFNDAIAEIKNGDWKTAGFAIEPEYSYAKNENLYQKEIDGEYDSKLKAHILTLNLKAEHEYVIYVRNVSAVRELDDGSVVSLSAMGSVKKAKTTKSQVKSLELDFAIKTGEKGDKNTVTHPVDEAGNVHVDEYEVELSAKKAQLNVYGLFSDTDDAAETDDQLRYPLVPTSKDKAVKDALKNYQMPKLEYVILDKNTDTPFDPAEKQSKYATINKKGLISLKGVDLNGEAKVYIYVRDNTQHQGQKDYGFTPAGDMIPLTITAKATSVTGKKVKAVVGQEIRLADCLTYKDGKKTLPNYRSGNIQITPEMRNAAEENGYRIEDRYTRYAWDGKNNRWVHDWYITAVSPNKNKFVLEVSDFGIDGNPKASITLTSKQMDSVKGLKVTYVDDKNITINFTHAANKNEADNGQVYQYAFEIKDARENVVEKRILSNPTLVVNSDRANAKELKSVLSWIQKPDTNVSTDKLKDNAITVPKEAAENQFNYYTGTNAKVKTFAYTYTNEKLVRLSSYTISVTPLYGNQKADKAATKKTKTTNIPASYKNPDLTGNAPDRRGGTGVEVTATAKNRQKDTDGASAKKSVNIIENSAYPFVSGNTYTLKINEDLRNEDVPRDRVTDTLTWKSSNTKVATIKANAGTYTATFKPVNQGETTITVTSKVTKKVIARHAVKVVAVRDGVGYGGDYEPTWDTGFYEKILALYDPYYDGPVEVLSMNVPLNINADTQRWISFTAPHYGNYTFNYSGPFFDSKDGKEIAGRNDNELLLEEGQKVYFKTSGRVTVEGSEYARLTQVNTKENPLEVKAGVVSFTAWEDNTYTFWLNGEKVSLNDDDDTEVSLRAGETYPIWPERDGKMYVTWRELVAATLTSPNDVTFDKDNQDRYVTFTADVAGEYAFKYVIPADGNVEVKYVVKDDESKEITVNDFGDEKDGTKESVEKLYLEKSQKVVIKFHAEITDAAKTLSASVTVTLQGRKDEWKDGAITIPKGTEEIIEYVIPAFTTEKARFKFEVTGEDGTIINRYYNHQDMKEPETVGRKSFTLTAGKEDKVKPGDSIYIEVTAGDDSENKDAKDAVLKVTQMLPEALTGEKSETITNGMEKWYTFKALADGFYQFNAAVDPKAGEEEQYTHDVNFTLYRKLFDENTYVGSKGTILSLKSGETLAIKLTPVRDVVKLKEDGTEEAVTSTAKVSVKELTVNSLKLGKDKAEPVKMAKASKEVKYYSFTAAVDADYTIAWQPTDKEKADNAKVTFFTGDVTSNSYSSTIWAGRLGVGGIKYVKVEVKDTGEDAVDVDGTLCVTSDNLSATALTEGIPDTYKLEGEGDPDVKVYRFTAPKAGNYTVVTTLGENPETKLPYTSNPDIYVENYGDIYPPETLYFEKGETRYITLTSYEKIEGTILVRSESQEFDETKPDASVANGETKQYTFEITESGRYEFKADADKADVRVSDDKAVNMTLANASGRYYRRNDVVTISVTGRNSEAAETVKLYKPAKIPPTTLVIEKSKSEEINLEAGNTGYYEISVTDPKTYELKVTDIVGTAYANVWCAENNGGLTPKGNCNSATSVDIPRNGKLFIKIKSNDEKTALKCKLNIAESRELHVGDNTVSLEAGETANLIFRAPETGYYSFEVNQQNAELLFKGKTGDSFYQIDPLNAKDKITYTLKNEGTAKVDLTVVIKAVEPIAVTPGSKGEATDIPADGEAYFALKTFKKADYLIKISDTSKGKDLEIYLNGAEEPSTAKPNDDGIVMLNENLSAETMLRIKNDGIAKTSITVELAVDDAQPLPADGVITLKKGESKKIKYVAAEESRYMISKGKDEANDHVKMTLDYKWDAEAGLPQPSKGNGKVEYTEEILHRADKLVYTLTYNPTDDKAPATQTVKVTIAKIDTPEITNPTKVEIKEKGISSVWYQFTAKKDAVYTFSLEDENENAVDGKMSFYSYLTQKNGETLSEKIMKTGEKLFIELKNLDEDVKYTLKYTEVDTIKVNDVDALDFGYENEVQEVKFVVPKAGIYRVSAAVFRGEFDVSGTVGNENVVESFTAPQTGSGTTKLLNKDDVLTLKVKANKGGKSSVSIRIAEESVAKTMTLGTEEAGDINTGEPIYYEIRIDETAKYVISASGPVGSIMYSLDGADFEEVSDVVYKDFEKNNRVIIKVESDTEGVYSVKIEKVSADSLDSNDTAEKAFTATEGEKGYRFTKKNAFVKFTAPAAGKYYIAVDEIDNVNFDDASFDPALSSENWTKPAGMVTLTKDQKVVFTFTNLTVEDEPEEPAARAAKESKEAMFRLTIRAAKAAEQNPITAGETKKGTLAKNESVSYQFKAAKEASYVLGFKRVGCDVEVSTEDWEIGAIRKFTANETLDLKVKNTTDKIGRYELTVTEFAPKKLTLGVTEQGTLKKGEKAYYEFAADGEKTYQVYVSGTDFYGSYAIVDKEGNGKESVDIDENKNTEVKLQNGEKLAFELGCNDDATKNAGFKLTVKEIKYATIEADKAVSRSLDARENAYYEFTSQNEKKTPYMVTSDNGVTVRAVRFEGDGADRKLGDPKPATVNETLEKGEKLQITVKNPSDKKDSYTLTVEDQTEPEVKPIALTLGEKVTGKLYSDKERAVYEFTADADVTYSAYFTGSKCAYKQERTSEADGKTTTPPIKTGNFGSAGSAEFICEKGDKITFTVSGSGKYELTVNKVTYVPLTQGTTVSKTLNPQETVYYEFTSTDTPATGEETTKYQVYGSGSIMTRTLTVGDDGKTDADSQDWNYNWSGEKELPKDKKILQFKVTNSSDEGTASFNLTIKKVEYKAMTSGTAVEGIYTWADDGFPYYEFTATDTPAEGQTTTQYYVYGTNYFKYRTSSKEGEKLTWSDEYNGSAGMGIWLEKDQCVRFKVTSSPYSLTVAKYPEAKPITVGTEIKTGKMTNGQRLIYTLKYEEATPATYLLNYEDTYGVSVSVTAPNWKDNYRRIIMSKGDTLTVSITAYNVVDDFAFTLSEFKPEELILGTPVQKVFTSGEKAYYQYTVTKDADYVVVNTMNSRRGRLTYEVNGTSKGTLSNNINECDFKKDDVVLLIMESYYGKGSVQLALQEKPAESTALEEKETAISLKAGEVKYFNFTIPEAEKENGTQYMLSVQGESNVVYQIDEQGYLVDPEESNDLEISKDTSIYVANTSTSEKNCTITIKKFERTELTLGVGSEKTLQTGEKAYYKFTAPTTGYYVLTAKTWQYFNLCIYDSEDDWFRPWNGLTGFNFEGGETYTFDLQASYDITYTLEMQQYTNEPEEFPSYGTVTLKPGEVKRYIYRLSDNVEDDEYIVRIRKSQSVDLAYTVQEEYYSYNYMYEWEANSKTSFYPYSDFEVLVSNLLSSGNVSYEIEVERSPYIKCYWWEESDTESLYFEESQQTNLYRCYLDSDEGECTINIDDEDVRVEYAAGDPDEYGWSTLPENGEISWKYGWYIYLKVTYTGSETGKECELSYSITRTGNVSDD